MDTEEFMAESQEIFEKSYNKVLDHFLEKNMDLKRVVLLYECDPKDGEEDPFVGMMASPPNSSSEEIYDLLSTWGRMLLDQIREDNILFSRAEDTA